MTILLEAVKWHRYGHPLSQYSHLFRVGWHKDERSHEKNRQKSTKVSIPVKNYAIFTDIGIN